MTRHSNGEPCVVRLEAKREENEQKARRLAERFADAKRAAEAANEAKEKAWERAKEAGTSAERCATALACSGLDLILGPAVCCSGSDGIWHVASDAVYTSPPAPTCGRPRL